MSSSTSSSNVEEKPATRIPKVRIATVVVTFLGIFAAYELAIRAGAVPPGPGIIQGQGNVVHMEHLVHGKKKADVILAGSSITFNIPVDKIGKNWMNAGLGNDSMQTALEAMQRSEMKPKAVFIELNMTPAFLRGTDHEMLNQLYNPVTYFLTGNLMSLRQEYQPMNVVMNAARRKVFGSTEKLDRTVSPKVKKAAVDLQVSRYSEPLSEHDMDRIERAFQDLQKSLDYLESVGSKPLLHIIPGEPVVDACLRRVQLREMAMKRFPPTRYTWVPFPPGEWTTNDGIHIVPKDSRRYAEYLKAFYDQTVAGAS